MHREVVHGRKIPAIMISVVAITIALYIVEFLEMTLDKTFELYNLIQLLLLLSIVFVVFKEFKHCKLSYKYSIIADKLIINKLSSRGDNTLESIRMQDIVFIGKKADVPKGLCRIKCHGCYLSSHTKKNKYYCIYEKDGQLSKFIFEPSERLVKRVYDKINIEKDEAR